MKIRGCGGVGGLGVEPTGGRLGIGGAPAPWEGPVLWCGLWSLPLSKLLTGLSPGGKVQIPSIWAKGLMKASVQGDRFHCHWNWFSGRRRPGWGAIEKILRSKGEGERMKGMVYAGGPLM